MLAVEEICTITAKGQTTVPKTVRQALGVGYGGRIAFRVDGDTVTVRAIAENDDEDPALGPFLDLLAADIEARPEALQPLTQDWADRLEALVGDMGEVDLDAPIIGDVTL